MLKVSIIIPVYNVERYIERCARSLFEQTLDDIEYIFVNDCTPDKSMEVLSRILEDYPTRREQVGIINMPVNSGQAVATRIAISEAKGEYLIRCDADDSVDTDMYRIMYKKGKDGDYDIVTSDKYFCRDDHKTLNKLFKREYMEDNYRDRYLRNILNWHGNPTLHAVLVKHSVFNNDISYPEKRMGEDTTLLIQLAYYSPKIGYINRGLYNYFYNPSSTCHTSSETDCYRRVREYSENFELICKFLNGKGIADNYPKELES